MQIMDDVMDLFRLQVAEKRIKGKGDRQIMFLLIVDTLVINNAV